MIPQEEEDAIYEHAMEELNLQLTTMDEKGTCMSVFLSVCLSLCMYVIIYLWMDGWMDGCLALGCWLYTGMICELLAVHWDWLYCRLLLPSPLLHLPSPAGCWWQL